ncbi:unnamed protein product [Vicia faba]|uniref:Uncharacterized protein n=1 Tax=Vicia faba TaxID=3906 RepID=A0AAV0YZ20_VICFA|nr:unnamed protein product [Vicia faba]
MLYLELTSVFDKLRRNTVMPSFVDRESIVSTLDLCLLRDTLQPLCLNLSAFFILINSRLFNISSLVIAVATRTRGQSLEIQCINLQPCHELFHLCMLNCVVGTDVDIDVAGYVRWTSVVAARILAMVRWLEIGEVQSNNGIKVKMAVMMRLFV